MADVTGKIYECFTEYLLRRIGWAPGPGSGERREFLCGRTVPARCHTSTSICAHAEACSAFSKEQKLPYGPWYDPDFFLTEAGDPFGCIHVTHWSNPGYSQSKFWRTIEDHFQYKSFFGHEFISINFVFEALDEDAAPRLVQDSEDLVELHGWSPANGATHATSYDASVLFPLRYTPIQAFVASLPTPMPKLSAAKRREFYQDAWDALCGSDSQAREQVDKCIRLLRQALQFDPHPRYSPAVVRHLQDVCFRGRQLAAGSRTTCSRYRKGIQHAFIIRELIAEYWGSRVDPDEALWRILTTSPRFPVSNFRSLLGLSEQTADAELTAWRNLLAKVSVRMVQRVPVPLLDATAGVCEMVAWDPHTSMFIQGVRGLPATDFAAFRRQIDALFDEYRTAYGMNFAILDLAKPERVEDKVNYIRKRYFSANTFAEFSRLFVPDMLSPYTNPPHQGVVQDVHNWPIDVLFVAFSLGSYQVLNTSLPQLFQREQGHSIRPYAFMNDYKKLTNHLMSGVPLGQYFSGKCKLAEKDFYEVLWPLVAESLWQNIEGKEPLAEEEIVTRFRYKKAQRIITHSDPIKFLFRRSLPDMEPGPTLRGAFNQLSTERGWSRAALTTKASGLDPISSAIIQTQTVVGAKNIDHKVKELSSRIRAVHLKLAADETFVPEPDPGVHYLVVDGDWPIESKINLYEAGFSGIFEIGELDRLSAALEKLGDGE